MATVAGLQSEMKRLRTRLAKQGAPRHWFFHLESAEEIPAAIEAKFRPDDEVVIREYPREYFGDLATFEGRSIGYAMTPGGAFIVWPDGRLEKVVKR